MKRISFLLIILTFCSFSFSQNKDSLDNQTLIKLYKGLRVADVCDGMDMVGLKDAGLMDPKIAPLWKDIQGYTHQFVGIAFTVRYVPTMRVPHPEGATLEEYKQWRDEWYTNLSGEPFIKDIRPGDVIIIDNENNGDCGTTGSNNSLLWTSKGAVGIVSAGGVRDVDEIEKQRIPLYMDYFKRGRGIRPGRNELESYNRPITVGGVYIHPGDVIVADGDGVIVVPRKMAVKVADAAREELNIDKNARRKLYEELGIPFDFTVTE